MISIHAPSRERLIILEDSKNIWKFQSTLPRGSDITPPLKMIHKARFQSTLPRGSDMLMFRSLAIIWNFNPRSLAGATAKKSKFIVSYLFQSTLPRGSDLNDRNALIGMSISIHAPSRERQSVCSPVMGDQHFNPRSLAGATYDKLYDAINHDISIHAPSRERHC